MGRWPSGQIVDYSTHANYIATTNLHNTVRYLQAPLVMIVSIGMKWWQGLTNIKCYCIHYRSSPYIRYWSLITGRRAAKWESRGSETFCVPPPPPPRQGKTLFASLLKGVNFWRPHPPSIWIMISSRKWKATISMLIKRNVHNYLLWISA